MKNRSARAIRPSTWTIIHMSTLCMYSLLHTGKSNFSHVLNSVVEIAHSYSSVNCLQVSVNTMDAKRID